MKKISHNLLSFGLIFLFSCTHSNKKPPKGLEGTWLSVYSKQGEWENVGLYLGYFMKIQNGKRTYQWAFSNTLVHENVTFNDSTIIIDDSTSLRIDYIGNDRLQLTFPWDTTLVTYVKLPFKNRGQIEIKKSDLTEFEWYLINEEERFRVDFIDHNYKLDFQDKNFTLGYNILNWGEYFGWDIMEFDHHTYFISNAFSIFEPMVYQITESNGNTIKLSYFDTYFSKEFKEIKLVKSKPLSNEKYQQQVNKLANHKFKLTDYHFKSPYDTIGWDTVLLKRINRFFTKFGIGKEMTFKFTNDSLFITNNIGGEYSKGTWELSKDGEIIKAVTKNGHLIIGIMDIDLIEKLKIKIKGVSNTQQLYNSAQIDYLELELEKY